MSCHCVTILNPKHEAAQPARRSRERRRSSPATKRPAAVRCRSAPRSKPTAAHTFEDPPAATEDAHRGGPRRGLHRLPARGRGRAAPSARQFPARSAGPPSSPTARTREPAATGASRPILLRHLHAHPRRHVRLGARRRIGGAARRRTRRSRRTKQVYVLTRPPGHHAERDRCGGYCYFNNAASPPTRLCRSSVRSRSSISTFTTVTARSTSSTIARTCSPCPSTATRPGSIRSSRVTATRPARVPGLGFNFNLPLPPGTAAKEYRAADSPALRGGRQVRPGIPGAGVRRRYARIRPHRRLQAPRRFLPRNGHGHPRTRPAGRRSRRKGVITRIARNLRRGLPRGAGGAGRVRLSCSCRAIRLSTNYRNRCHVAFHFRSCIRSVPRFVRIKHARTHLVERHGFPWR